MGKTIPHAGFETIKKEKLANRKHSYVSSSWLLIKYDQMPPWLSGKDVLNNHTISHNKPFFLSFCFLVMYFFTEMSKISSIIGTVQKSRDQEEGHPTGAES